MFWALIIIGLIALAVFSPAFRFVAGVIVALIIGVGLVLYIYYQAKDERSKTLIKPTEITLSDVQMTGNEMRGVVANKSSRYRLTRLTLRMVIEDCKAEQKRQCVTVGEAEDSDYLDVPPRQARSFEVRFYFSNLPPVGERTRSFTYSIASIRGE